MSSEKEVFVLGSARIEVSENMVWLQSGIAGLMLGFQELCDLYDLLVALMEEDMDEDDDQIQLGESPWIAVAEGMRNIVTGKFITFKELEGYENASEED